MNIQLISLRKTHDHCTARAHVTADGARLWIEVRFQSQQCDPWSEAYDRVLALLDPA